MVLCRILQSSRVVRQDPCFRGRVTNCCGRASACVHRGVGAARELPRQMPVSQSTTMLRSTVQSRASCQRKMAPRASPVRPWIPMKMLSLMSSRRGT